MEDKYLSTGITNFNLQLTGDARKGIKAGSYVFTIGDSSAGKSFLAATIAAQAVIAPDFADYDVVYDDVENGCSFDMKTLFSERVAKSIKTPMHGTSVFIDDFYHNVRSHVQEKPTVYILDSQDALTSKEESGKFKDISSAIEKAKGDTEKALAGLSGQMADGKAKKHSQLLRKLVTMLEANGSILVILGQTRDDLTGYAKDGLVWSGGRALKFYSHIMLHMAVGERMSRTVNGTKREMGIVSKTKVIKNRQTGKRSEAKCPIYYTHGFDDVGAMIDFMVDEKVWAVTKGTGVIRTGNFSRQDLPDGKRETLVKRVDESETLYDALVDLCQTTWDAVETKLAVTRKNRYA